MRRSPRKPRRKPTDAALMERYLKQRGINLPPSGRPAEEETPIRDLKPEASAAIDALMESDRQWFAEHPGEKSFIRPSEDADFPEGIGDGPDRPPFIEVTELRPGFRIRRGLFLRLVDPARN